MTKIIVYNNWGDSPDAWANRLSKQSPNGRRWNQIELVSEIDQADIVIICDGIQSLNKEEFHQFVNKPKIYLQSQ